MEYQGSYTIGADEIELLPDTFCDIVHITINSLFIKTDNKVIYGDTDYWVDYKCFVLKSITLKDEPIKFKLSEDSNMYQCISCIFDNINGVVKFTTTNVDDV